MTENSSLCNEGSPPYFENFLILPKSIKVSMKKKRKKRGGGLGGRGALHIYSGVMGPCTAANPQQSAKSPSALWMPAGEPCPEMRKTSSCRARKLQLATSFV